MASGEDALVGCATTCGTSTPTPLSQEEVLLVLFGAQCPLPVGLWGQSAP